jgi:lysophospholipase L1-like esterase
MMRRIATTFAVVTLVTTAAMAGAAPALAAHHTTATTPATYYLSLGDSLSQGVQPNKSGQSVETNQGYPNQLFTALHMTNTTLKLVKLGCPGETTATMINGGICTYPTGSQLKQAVAFISKHHASIKLITIDIGANDLNPCVTLTNLTKLVKCLQKAFGVIKTNLATIMATLTAAGGSNLPTTIGMTYYVPELAGWLKGTPAAKTLAKDSVALGQGFGSLLSGVYTAFGAKVADVFDAFQSTVPFSKKVNTAAFGRIPLAVAYVCSYTWQCAPPPRGPNEHANILGYGVIANTFLTTYLGT